MGAGLSTQLEGSFPASSNRLLAQFSSPGPLTAAEERSEAVSVLAKRHVPALALCNPNMWPVDVSYCWHDGSPVYTECSPGRRQTVVRHEQLIAGEFMPPPPDFGNPKHYIDAPGRGPTSHPTAEGWATAWARIQGTDPATAPYPPTQYVHAFWLNRALGLLALQYWFFYPFNDWVNRHEGDWEHVVVVLEGSNQRSQPDDFALLTTFFYFHEWMAEPKRFLHLGGLTPAHRHPVVFVGGQGDMWDLWRCSHHQSGGSYAWPGRYRNAGSDRGWIFSPAEQVATPQRFLDPEAFRLVMLPEPQRVSRDTSPELWWLRWNLYFGQKRLLGDMPLAGLIGMDHPPPQPGRHGDWNMRRYRSIWPGHEPTPPLPTLPAQWQRRVLPRVAPAAVT